MDELAIAKSFYPTMKPETPAPAEPVAAAAEPVPSTAEQLTESFYGKPEKVEVLVPEEVAKLRDTPEAKMYDAAKAYSPVPWDGMLDALPSETRTATIDEVHRMASDIGATSEDVKQLVSEGALLTQAPPTTEQRAEMQSEASRQLVVKYGAEATAVLDATKRLVARDPRLGRLLEATALGSSPRVVMKLAELAQQQIRMGRLK